MPNAATCFLQSTAQRTGEVPNASWTTGVNNAAANAPGIGIATDPVSDLDQQLPNWTLLDQDGAARTPQVSQHIGGDGSTNGSSGKGTEGIHVISNPTSSDGSVTVDGEATLSSLTTGWTVV